MEQNLALALILFAAFWVGAFAGFMAMRMRLTAAFDKGKSDSVGELAALNERLFGREQQIVELKKQNDQQLVELSRAAAEAKADGDRRAMAEARSALIPKFEQELEVRGKKITEQSNEVTRLQGAVTELTARIEETRKASDDRAASLNDIQAAIQAKLGESIHALSSEALKTNNQAFLDMAHMALAKFQETAKGDLDLRQQSIKDMVQPIAASLDKVDTRIVELEKERAGAYAGITQQVENLLRSQDGLKAETQNLVNALRTPSARGRWGEVQLRRVVELAGMLEYCDFTTQESVMTEDGLLRPDLIVQLPNHRRIVVDSKVSLSAYLEALDAPDESARVDKLRQHAQQVRSHLNRLSAKQYWDQFAQSPEFVIAFLPGDTFYSAALEHDPTLLEFGVERRVILATPTTLIALLKAIAYGWRQEKVSANAREIRDLGKSLFDRLRTLAEHFAELQKNLERTNHSFNKTIGALESRVFTSARRFRDLGAASGDDIATVHTVESTPRSLRLLSEATAEELEGEPEAIAEPEIAAEAPLDPQPDEVKTDESLLEQALEASVM